MLVAFICFVGWAVARLVSSAAPSCHHWFLHFSRPPHLTTTPSVHPSVRPSSLQRLPRRARARSPGHRRTRRYRNGVMRIPSLVLPQTSAGRQSVTEQVLLSGAPQTDWTGCCLASSTFPSVCLPLEIVLFNSVVVAMSSFQWQKLSPNEFHQLLEYTSCKYCFLINVNSYCLYFISLSNSVQCTLIIIRYFLRLSFILKNLWLVKQ